MQILRERFCRFDYYQDYPYRLYCKKVQYPVLFIAVTGIFANIGLQVVLPKMSTMIIVFAVVLVLVAVLTKVVGCGLGAKLCKYSNQDCMRIGTGMISRGEVALIVASKGNAVGLMSADLLGPVVIVVVITTIIAPIF